MKTTLKCICSFGIGVVAGALICRNFYKNKYETIANEAISSIKESYSKPKSDSDKPSKDEIVKKLERENIENDKKAEEAIKMTENRERVDYRGYYGNPVIDEKVEKMAERESPKESDKHPGAYIITEDEYNDGEPYFDKMSCTFYVPNSVVVDDITREVVEPDIIGADNIEVMINLAQNNDSSMIWIRNEDISCDMEISIERMSIEDAGAMVWFGGE